MLVLRGPRVWGARGMCVRVLRVCSEHRAGPAGEQGSHGGVRGPGSRQGCWGDRGAVLVLGGPASTRVLEEAATVLTPLNC